MFFFFKKHGCNIEITKEPRVIWKIVHVEDKIWRPIYFGTTLYLYNAKYEACEHLEVKEDGRIYAGFHAFTNPDIAVREKQKILEKLSPGDKVIDRYNIQVLRCVIPEESEYCLGENNQIVSSCIRVFRDDKILESYLQNWGTEITQTNLLVRMHVSRLYKDLFGYSWRPGYRCNRICNINVTVYEEKQEDKLQIPVSAVIPKGTRIRRKQCGEIETSKIIVFTNYKKFKRYWNNL